MEEIEGWASEDDVGEYLMEAILEYAREYDEPEPRIETFEQAGLLTSNKGLVIRAGEAEYQITIVRSK